MSTNPLFAGKEGDKADHGEASEHGGGEGGEDSKNKVKPYITIGPLTISIVKADEIKGYLRFTINLWTQTEKNFEYVRSLAPYLRSEYIIQLSSILSNFWITGSEPRLDNIKNILQQITNKILGPGKAQAVLFDNFFFARPPENLREPFAASEQKNISTPQISPKASSSNAAEAH